MIWWVFFTIWSYAGNTRPDAEFAHTKDLCETRRSASITISSVIEEKEQVKLEEISDCMQVVTHNPLIENMPKCDNVPRGTLPACRP